MTGHVLLWHYYMPRVVVGGWGNFFEHRFGYYKISCINQGGVEASQRGRRLLRRWCWYGYDITVSQSHSSSASRNPQVTWSLRLQTHSGTKSSSGSCNCRGWWHWKVSPPTVSSVSQRNVIQVNLDFRTWKRPPPGTLPYLPLGNGWICTSQGLVGCGCGFTLYLGERPLLSARLND